MDELSELRPQFEASEARVAALQDELKRSHSQAAAAAASADQRIQVLSPLRYSCLGIFLDFLISISLSALVIAVIGFYTLVVGGVCVVTYTSPPSAAQVVRHAGSSFDQQRREERPCLGIFLFVSQCCWRVSNACTARQRQLLPLPIRGRRRA